MNERHPRNAGLPSGIRMVISGWQAGQYEVRATGIAPGSFVVRPDGSLAAKRRRVRVARTVSLAAALRIQREYREAAAARSETRRAYMETL
jgi:hypothetical protein